MSSNLESSSKQMSNEGPKQSYESMMTLVEDEVDYRAAEKKNVTNVTSLIMEQIARELEASKDTMKVQVIQPLIHILYSHLFPYVMLVCVVMLIILLTSLCTCAMFALFMFTSRSRTSAR